MKWLLSAFSLPLSAIHRPLTADRGDYTVFVDYYCVPNSGLTTEVD